MNIVLTGGTGSGKTEICKKLTEFLGYDKIVSYTTRNIRNNETDGVDYHFVSEEEFKAIDGILKTINLNNMYCIKKEELENANRKVIIVDKTGLDELKKIDGLEFCSFFISSDKDIRYDRCLKRGDKKEKIDERMEEEQYNLYQIDADCTIFNESEDIWDAVISILEYVKDVVYCSHQDYIK